MISNFSIDLTDFGNDIFNYLEFFHISLAELDTLVDGDFLQSEHCFIRFTSSVQSKSILCKLSFSSVFLLSFQ